MSDWPRIAVVGAGAVGGYFGGVLAQAGAPVVMIGRKQFVDAVATNGLVLDSGNIRERIRVEATTDINAVRDASVVLFCVKTPDTSSAAREMAQHLGAGAAVVCLQNGVDNVERIRHTANIEAVAAAVY